MGKLKSENYNICMSLLKEFIVEASVEGEKRERAILALEQLRRITAGADIQDNPVVLGDDVVIGDVEFMCTGRPRAYTLP